MLPGQSEMNGPIVDSEALQDPCEGTGVYVSHNGSRTCGRIHVLDVAKKRGSCAKDAPEGTAGRVAESDLRSIGVLRSLRSPLMGGGRQESDFRAIRDLATVSSFVVGALVACISRSTS